MIFLWIILGVAIGLGLAYALLHWAWMDKPPGEKFILNLFRR